MTDDDQSVTWDLATCREILDGVEVDDPLRRRAAALRVYYLAGIGERWQQAVQQMLERRRRSW
jgi:hypothetical protein